MQSYDTVKFSIYTVQKICVFVQYGHTVYSNITHNLCDHPLQSYSVSGRFNRRAHATFGTELVFDSVFISVRCNSGFQFERIVFQGLDLINGVTGDDVCVVWDIFNRKGLDVLLKLHFFVIVSIQNDV